MKSPIVVINGPTASGKSSLAVAIALKLAETGVAAEVINADAMLVYRGMDIGTAKPSVEDQRRVRHHLLDFLDITQTATVADFQRRAREAILDCQQRGVISLVTGGSALYVRGIVDEFEFPPADPDVRARIEADVESLGLAAVRARLLDVAPAAAAAIEPGNARRIVRALEIFELTGNASGRLPEPHYALDAVLQVGLELPRPVMDERIEQRVQQMWADGLVDEVRALEVLGLRRGLTAPRAIGYQQVLEYLEGEITEEQAQERVITRTRRFSRKQLSWFRRDPRIVWFDALDEDLVEHVVRAIGDFAPNSVGGRALS